ncbi:hypothetical protein [Nocardioides sp. NPDC006273]|uniref:hypothetical protein n=1 Tax=Nocardioides sp. NPDC006273 TaxID=3155598 RepID=UPI0033A66E2A
MSVTWKVNNRGGGETFVKCHGGCDRRDVLAAVGLGDSDRYDTPARVTRDNGRVSQRRVTAGVTDTGDTTPGVTGAVTVTGGVTDTGDTPAVTPAGDKKRAGGRAQLVATYTYTDVDGVRLYDIRRWANGNVKFSARTYDEHGARVVSKKAPHRARRVLYNLPAVVAAETVWLCEGEKDADSVAEALQKAAESSSAATTAPFGAADKPGRASAVWLPQYVEALTGKHVRIFTDRDVAGYRHALHVAESLVDVAASVDVIEAATGNDATDHLSAGLSLTQVVTVTREELVTRAAMSQAEVSPEAVSQTAVSPEAMSQTVVTGAVVTGVTDTVVTGVTGTDGAGVTDTAGVTGDTGAGDTGRDTGTPGKLLMFPARKPLSSPRPLPTTQYVESDGQIWEVRRKRLETGEWIDELRLVLGCKATMTAQYLGGLVGDEDADKLAQARLERVELLCKHPETGEELMLVVNAREWRSGEWLDALWPGVEFAHSRDGRAKVAAAIKALSPEAERLAEQKATGWRTLPGHGRAFVHAGGAITAAGLVPMATGLVGPLRQYELPAPPATAEELRAAAAHSVGLLTDEELAPRVGLVLAGTAYRSVLGRTGFVPAFVGAPASGKTALSIICLQHFGGRQIHRDVRFSIQMDPEHGATAKAGKVWLHRAADVPMVFDDFAPDKGPAAAAQRMGQFIRAAYNGGGRDRLTREGDLQEGIEPRGIPLVTAEMLPSSPSARQRMLNVPSQWAAVDVPTVRRLQAEDAADARALFMSALIQWAAGQDEAELTTKVRDLEAGAVKQLQQLEFTARTSEHVSRLYAGWRIVCEFLVDAGAWSLEEGLSFRNNHVWPATLAAAKADSDADDERDMGRWFLRLVGESMLAQKAHVTDDAGRVPNELSPILSPTACGWRPGLGDGVVMPSGDRIGYVRTDAKTGELRLLLLPKEAATVAAKAAAEANIELGLTVAGLSEALDNAGVGLRTTTEAGKCQRQVKASIAGARARVWDLPLSAVWGDEDDSAPADGPVDGPPDEGGRGPGAGPATGPAAGPGAAPAPADPGPEIVRLQEPAPCAGCDSEFLASHAVNGVPLHVGECSAPASPSVGIELDEPLPELAPAAEVPAQKKADEIPPAKKGHNGRRRERGEALSVEASEISECLQWAAATGDELTETQAAAVVERFHHVTGCRWKGPHGTIWSLLTGHTKWPNAKAPEISDLGLFEELRSEDRFWSARSWIVTPGDPAENSSIAAADVNAQYVASASSVEVGEGDPLHYEAGDELPANVYKLPGWVRLAAAVKDAPHGLELPADMWIPTPLAVYLTRDHKLSLKVDEALVWPKKRRALATLSNHFRDWSQELKADQSPAGAYALRMVKTLYTKALGGYLASEKGLTPAEWHRPDWALLLKAQAEANMLRGLDKLPAGAVVRAKYADAAFIELPAGVDLASWDRLDELQPGRWKLVGEPVPAAPSFRGLRPTADAWRVAYETAHSAAEEVQA